MDPRLRGDDVGRFLRSILALFALLLAFTSPAAAHPHVWVTAASELLYAAGYYSYMWSEVMDADAFGAFEEAGNIFDPATAKRLLDDIYSSGGSRDPEDAYIAFRGREPEPEALLRRRGLLDVPEAA